MISTAYRVDRNSEFIAYAKKLICVSACTKLTHCHASGSTCVGTAAHSARDFNAASTIQTNGPANSTTSAISTMYFDAALVLFRRRWRATSG